MDNKILMYFLIYLVLPILTFYNFKFVKIEISENNFLERNNTDVTKGLLALLIVSHHFIQEIINLEYLYPFAFIGYMCVGIFLFLSGYSLTTGFLIKENYLKGYFTKRLQMLYVPFILSNIVMGIASNVLLNNNNTPTEVIWNSLTFESMYGDVTYWFIKSLIYSYIIFYLTMKFLKNKNHIIITNFIAALLYLIVLYNLGYENFWVNTAFCFPIGMVIGFNKEKVIKALNKRSTSLLMTTFVLFSLTFVIKAIGTVKGMPFRELLLITEIINVIFLCGFVTVFLSAVQLKSKFMSYMGKHSYEIYILHIPILYITLDYTKNISGILFLSIVLLAILLSIVIQFISNKIINSFKFIN